MDRDFVDFYEETRKNRRKSGNQGESNIKKIETENNRSKRRESWDSQLKKLPNEVVESKTDLVEVVKEMSLVDVLSKACLKKHHRILLPLLILLTNQTSEKEATKSPNFDNEVEHHKVERSPENFNKGSRNRKEKRQDKKSSSKEIPGRRSQGFLDYKSIYEALKQIQPRNSVEKICNDQILRYLSTIFEQV